MATKFIEKFKKKGKKEEATKETLDKLNREIEEGIKQYFSSVVYEYQKMEEELQNTTATPTLEIKPDDIDSILDEYIKNSTERYKAGRLSGSYDELQAKLNTTIKKLHSYFNLYGYEEIMQKYEGNDYKKYSIIDLEKELLNEKNDNILNACRSQLYSDRVVHNMYRRGIDTYRDCFMFFTEPFNRKENGYWLERRLIQQNSIENAHFTDETEKAHVLEYAQMGWKNSSTGLPGIDLENAVKVIFARDFDEGYWVQTELEILTLPVEQKQAIRKFREQNKKDGIYFEPGTIINQYTENSRIDFQAGTKK